MMAKKSKYKFNPKYYNCDCGHRVEVHEAIIEEGYSICTTCIEREQLEQKLNKPYWLDEYAKEKDWN